MVVVIIFKRVALAMSSLYCVNLLSFHVLSRKWKRVKLMEKCFF